MIDGGVGGAGGVADAAEDVSGSKRDARPDDWKPVWGSAYHRDYRLRVVKGDDDVLLERSVHLVAGDNPPFDLQIW